VRHELLYADISYTHLDECTSQDDFLLANPCIDISSLGLHAIFSQHLS
jgi:hypothetical protein